MSERAHHRVGAIVPVLNEAEAIVAVVQGLLAHGVDHVVVVDGRSTDDSAARARAAGAHVVEEPRPGYGRAIMTGAEALPADITIVLQFDGDGSDRPELVPSVIAPLLDGRADFVMGSRLLGVREPGSLGLSQIVAGRLAGLLLRAAYGVHVSDMSPFRALRRETLQGLGMTEDTFGWNLEMQMRIAAAGLRMVEVPVGQRRRRGGVSKVSGNIRASVRAATTISLTFLRLIAHLRTTARHVR